MGYTTKIVKTQRLSDGMLAVTIRVNDDPTTDSTLTMYNVALMTQDQIQGVIDKQHQLVAARALAMDQITAQVKGLTIKSVTHDQADLQNVLTSQQPTPAQVGRATDIEVPAVVNDKVPVEVSPGITVAQPASKGKGK